MAVDWEEIAPIPLPFNTHCFPAPDTLIFMASICVCNVPKNDT
jgi:hypothetical protein